MQASEHSSSNSKHTLPEQLAMRQKDFPNVPQRRIDPPSRQTGYWQQAKQEDMNYGLSFSSFVGDPDSPGVTNSQPRFRASDAFTTMSGYHSNHINVRPSSQNASDSSTSQTSVEWSPLEVFPDVSFPPPLAPVPCNTESGHTESGRILQPQHVPPASARSSCIRSSFSSKIAEFGESFTPRAGTPGGSIGDRDGESSRLKDIQESIHCFWLVSENRTTQIQDDLTKMSTLLKGALEEQDKLNSQMRQVLPLQVEITQKVVRAAEDRKVIFGRLKSMQETSTAWQAELKHMLETMQTEVRAGMETMQASIAKSRKAPQPRARSGTTGTAASVSVSSTTSSNKSGKRASPPRKKTSPQGDKKIRLVSADDEDRTAPTPPRSVGVNASPSQERHQQQQSTYDHQHHQLQQQQQQHLQRRPHTAETWQPDFQFRSHSLSVPHEQRSSVSLDHVQLQARPYTAEPCVQNAQHGMGSFEMTMQSLS